MGKAVALLQSLGAAATGLMGFSFVVLAFYLFYNEYRTAEAFRVNFLMMPMMNVLISSMLLFYSRVLYRKAKATRETLRDGTFVPPRIFVTRYDIAAIIAFILVVAVVSYLLIR